MQIMVHTNKLVINKNPFSITYSLRTNSREPGHFAVGTTVRIARCEVLIYDRLENKSVKIGHKYISSLKLPTMYEKYLPI